MPRDTPLTPIGALPGMGPVISHPEFYTLTVAVTAALRLTAPFQEHLFRATAPPYVTPLTFFSGAGAARTGGRWNPPGIHTVYLAATPELAVSEYLAAGRARGTPDHEAHPVTTEASKVVVSRCLDLRTIAVRAALNLDIDAFVNEDFQALAIHGREAMSQAFGRAVHPAGIQAIIVPSRIDPILHNVAVFRSLLGVPDRCEPLHPGLLLPDTI